MLELEEKIAGEIVISENPGATLRKWREMFGITQQELSKFLKISPSVISDYESGRRKSPGIVTIKKIVKAFITIDLSRGGKIVKKYSPGYGSDAIISIREFRRSAKASEIISLIEGTNLARDVSLERNIYGYTMIDSIKAILEFSSQDFFKFYGWSNERALIFTGVKFGRSPLVAIRAHPLKPAMVVFVKPENVDELSIKLAELENIPLVITDLDEKSIISRLGDL